jgi:hypothetical protein
MEGMEAFSDHSPFGIRISPFSLATPGFTAAEEMAY